MRTNPKFKKIGKKYLGRFIIAETRFAINVQVFEGILKLIHLGGRTTWSYPPYTKQW